MGTLDDAIREHLELKKRSGAPDDEVQRLEHEAFGPVRREEAAPLAEVEPEPAAAAEPAALDEPLADAGPEAAPVFEPEPPELRREHEPEPEPAPRAPEPPGREPESWLGDDDLDEGPQPTREFTAAEAAQAEGRPAEDYVAPDDEGEDLLEETPDFLQETPEHDRLWFEQRPPRDFDFDQ
jgi:hypothetical protein